MQNNDLFPPLVCRLKTPPTFSSLSETLMKETLWVIDVRGTVHIYKRGKDSVLSRLAIQPNISPQFHQNIHNVSRISFCSLLAPWSIHTAPVSAAELTDCRQIHAAPLRAELWVKCLLNDVATIKSCQSQCRGWEEPITPRIMVLHLFNHFIFTTKSVFRRFTLAHFYGGQ